MEGLLGSKSRDDVKITTALFHHGCLDHCLPFGSLFTKTEEAFRPLRTLNLTDDLVIG